MSYTLHVNVIILCSPILFFFPCSVRELSSFLQDTTLGLSDKVADGDYAGLVSIMGHLMAIRDRQISNDKHFKPLQSTAELLKTYEQQLPDSIYTQLEVCVGLQTHIVQTNSVNSYVHRLPVFIHTAGTAGEVEESQKDCVYSKT